MSTAQLVEHFFRHEYGRLVASLSCRVGVQHIEIIEDAVQSALMSALESWSVKGLPEKPSAWLFKVAHNNLMGDLRQRAGREYILKQNKETIADTLELVSEHYLSKELQDDMLRMLFVCCDPVIPLESQLVLALKILCGFSTREIAARLFTSEANVYKRLGRARNQLKKHSSHFKNLMLEDYFQRLSSVNQTLYLLFTEGYLSSHTDFAIRQELCEEAIRLMMILVKSQVGQTEEAYALLALMHFHMARMASRQNSSGGLLLLEEQDRSLWDQEQIIMGLKWLEKSAQGKILSRYHAEAGIAVEHCLSPSFSETRWDKIVECYVMLEQVAPSALCRLNRSIAVAEWKGPKEALAILESFKPPNWLIGSYQWLAVLADLHGRSNNLDIACQYRDEALNLAPTPAVKRLLQRRLNRW
ncbi:RNA polymerase sigma factor [Aliikangiella sp. IMCC44359]|uniref:RNA polymerase sigma factor n=1 Tax=Aliikangiella sp. IMCC44359 TaxID=3459125 RepID=UPI00403ABF55